MRHLMLVLLIAGLLVACDRYENNCPATGGAGGTAAPGAAGGEGEPGGDATGGGATGGSGGAGGSGAPGGGATGGDAGTNCNITVSKGQSLTGAQ